MDKFEEKALVRKLSRMDDEGWERFCKEYSALLLEFVRMSLGCGKEMAEEIVQMTFIRCVRSIRTFDPSRGRLLPWLKTVARNEAHTCLGNEHRRAAEMPFSSMPEHVAAQIARSLEREPLPDELLARQDTKMLVRECLMELNSRHREVLLSKYADGLKVSEIAQRRGVSEKAIESVLSRSRDSFKKVLLQKLASSQREAAELVK